MTQDFLLSGFVAALWTAAAPALALADMVRRGDGEIVWTRGA